MKTQLRFLTGILVLLLLLSGQMLAGQQGKLPPSWQALSGDGVITQFEVALENDTVAVSARYDIHFTLSERQIPHQALIEIAFPAAIGIDLIDSVGFNDVDTTNEDFQVDSFFVAGNMLSVVFADTGAAPPADVGATITLYGVNNPEVATSYQLAMVIYVNAEELAAPPAWSESFTFQPDQAVSLDLFPAGVQEARAGTVLHFWVEAKDQHDNSVNVPDSEVVWEVIGVPNQTGTVVDGNFQAMYTGGSRVKAVWGELEATSAVIFVLPGAFSYLSMTGGVDLATAGEGWPAGDGDIVVSAFDIYGNLVDEFDGEVYFYATDSIASIPAIESEPYQFTTGQNADNGIHTFSGSEFVFFTAGYSDLELIYDSQVEGQLRSIRILPGALADFSIELPDTVVAGENFDVTISDAADSWGNAVSATADLSLASGDGLSPDGATPSMPSFLVENGFGDATIRLVDAGDDVLVIDIDTVEKNSAIVVLPASLERFDFALDNFQISGQPFSGTATLTALDLFGNVVTAFDASLDPIAITASGSGTVFGNIIDSDDAFSVGVCDLTAIGTGYSGSEPFVLFTATSTSGKIGISPAVQFPLVKITGGRLESSVLYLGEQYHFDLTISNFSASLAVVDSIRVYLDDEPASLIMVEPFPPDTIAGTSSQTYTFTGDVPNLPGQTVIFSAAFDGNLEGAPAFDSVSNLASLVIREPTGLSALSGSLTPTQVSAGREYDFALRLRNEGEDDLRLTTDTRLSFTDNSEQVTAVDLAAPVVVEAAGGESELQFNDVVLPLTAAGTIDQITLSLVGRLGPIEYIETIVVPGAVLVQTPVNLTAVSGTLLPDLIYRGTNVAFSFAVDNNGTASLQLDQNGQELTLYAAERSLVTYLDGSVTLLDPGRTTLQFDSLFIPIDFPTRFDSATIKLSGISNEHFETAHLLLTELLPTIPSGGVVQLAGTHNMAINAPRVNVSQQFALEATVRNMGDEPLRDIVVTMASDGNSSFISTQTVDVLDVGHDAVLLFDVTASLTPTVSELFVVSITEADGASSGLPAQIMQPLDATQVVVIQIPASVSVVSEISSPPQAQDGIIKPGTDFEISAAILNFGQAGIGEGELTLSILGGGFTTTDPLIQSITSGSEAHWLIGAPDDIDTGMFEITMTEVPHDQNSGLAAKTIVRSDTIVVIVQNVEVRISVDFTASQSPLLTAGESVEVISFDFDVVGEAESPYLTYLELNLRDNDGDNLDPTTLLSSAQLLYNGHDNIEANFAGDKVRFSLGPTTGVPQSGVVTLSLSDNPSVSDFTLYLDSTSFAARYESAAGPEDIIVSAKFASTLVIEQEYTLVSNELEESFFCYPNPFSPLREEIKFSLNLSGGQSAILTIYTLAGDEVTKIAIESNAAPGSVTWDGRNSDGEIVLNGVYIAVLSVDGAGEVRTKVAVVK